MDRLQSLRARFRATVRTAESETEAQGLLLVRRPGAVRVKLFGIAGFTVYDALWKGDGVRVRGVVRGLGAEAPLDLEQTPARPVREPAARLSLLLWSLWQPRCPRPPHRVDPPVAPRSDAAADLVQLGLDPAPAQARSRMLLLEEGEVRVEHLQTADGEDVTVRFVDYDRDLTPSLPGRIEIRAPVSGWEASIEITEYVLDETLADALFAFPAEGGRGS